MAHLVMLGLMQLPLAHFKGMSRGQPCSLGQNILGLQEPSRHLTLFLEIHLFIGLFRQSDCCLTQKALMGQRRGRS